MGEVISSKGIVFKMLDVLAMKLNFSYSVVSPTDNDFGIRKKESSEFTGMMGQLINQDAFMAAAPFIINDRRMYVNFSVPFDMQPYTFMHRRPGNRDKFLIFVYPFTPLVRKNPNSLMENHLQVYKKFTNFFLVMALPWTYSFKCWAHPMDIAKIKLLLQI